MAFSDKKWPLTYQPMNNGITKRTQMLNFTQPTYNEKDFIKEIRPTGNDIKTEGA